MKRKIISNISLVLILFFSSCIEDVPIPTPKPKGYYRINFPEKKYQIFENGDCPCKFEYPKYATIEKQNLFFDKKITDPCWFNINMEQLNAKIHFTFKKINDKKALHQLLEDNHKLTYEHVKKADFINEDEFHTSNNVHGMLFDIGGDAASNYQFFLTDSTKHYLRGSLYFAAKPNRDSLAPVIQFVYKDLVHFINTFHWEK